MGQDSYFGVSRSEDGGHLVDMRHVFNKHRLIVIVYKAYSWCTTNGDSKRCTQSREQTKVTFGVGEVVRIYQAESLNSQPSDDENSV